MRSEAQARSLLLDISPNSVTHVSTSDMAAQPNSDLEPLATSAGNSETTPAAPRDHEIMGHRDCNQQQSFSNGQELTSHTCIHTYIHTYIHI